MADKPNLIAYNANSLREAFGEQIAELARENSDLFVLDADVAGGTGAHHIRSEKPEQFIQCGIAEQNMVGVAAGLASVGLKPWVTTFGVFMLRAFEQVRLSIAYSKKNVKLVASHPGLDVGPDGASAQCLEDFACMRSLPNMIVLSPCDALEVKAATKALLNHQGPAYMRTGRSECPNVFKNEPEFTIGKGHELKAGTDVTLVSTGVMTHRALSAADILDDLGISTAVIHMPTIKPIDVSIIHRAEQQSRLIVSCEDHSTTGGLGSAIAENLSLKFNTQFHRIGIHDVLGQSGEPDELASHYLIDAHGVAEQVRQRWEQI